MAAHRLLDPAPQYTKDDGTLVAGGTLYFFDVDGTTPKNAYSTSALSVSLGTSIVLDSAARVPTDCWLDGEYDVQLKDSDGVQVFLKADVRDAATGTLTPLDPATGTDQQVYSTDGVDALWRDVVEVPDPTGHSGKQLGNDGALVFWEAKTTYSETSLPAGLTDGASSVQIGKTLIQYGSATIPTAAAQTSSVAVTFSEAYTSAPKVVCSPTVGAVTGESGGVELSATSVTTAGFTGRAIAPDMGAVSGSENITSAVTFDWIAIGKVA